MAQKGSKDVSVRMAQTEEREERSVRAEASAPFDPFSRYLDEMKAYPVPSAQEELAFAKRIEELEIAHWQALLSYPPARAAIRTALKPHLREPKEFAALCKSAASAKRSASESKQAKDLITAAAKGLRWRDTTRVALAAAHAAVLEACRELSAARTYVQRIEKARAQEQTAKNRFMQANLRLVVALARRYKQQLLPLPDLIQEGNLGLMRAVERFDYKRGFRFSTYASWWIRHGFNRALSDRGRLVRVPVHLLDDAQRVAKARSALLATHGRPPTLEELAKKTALSEEKLTLIASYSNMRAPASLDTPLKSEGDSTLLDILASPTDVSLDEQLDNSRWSEGVKELLSVLTPIEASVVRLRFGLEHDQELTLQEIGERYNLSRERIRQLQVQALQKLRAELEEQRAA
jgi:RNA polymerase primary sigma factor